MIKDKPHTNTNQFLGELPWFIGMPICISNNIAGELGLTNGTSGTVKPIHLHNRETISDEDTGFHHVDFNDMDNITVELDNNVTVKSLRGLQPNHVHIFPQSGNFSVTLKRRNTDRKLKPISVNRTHFPIVPRFSVTEHKSQGLTLGKAIIRTR